jgi:hypothetical protein
VLWPLTTILVRLDPDFLTKLSLFKNLFGGSGEGEGGSGQPRSRP